MKEEREYLKDKEYIIILLMHQMLNQGLNNMQMSLCNWLVKLNNFLNQYATCALYNHLCNY